MDEERLKGMIKYLSIHYKGLGDYMIDTAENEDHIRYGHEHHGKSKVLDYLSYLLNIGFFDEKCK